jgi:hypothetical protein
MGVQAARPRDAIQDRRGRFRLAPRADRETEEQQRLDVAAIAIEQLAADALHLPALAALQQRQHFLQPRQPLRGIHVRPSCDMTETAVSAWVD